MSQNFDIEVQDFDEDCPKCGHVLSFRECPECADGFVDCYDDDPINYNQEEEEEDCPACKGYGRHIWCRHCGWDYLEEQYLNGKSEIDAGEQVREPDENKT